MLFMGDNGETDAAYEGIFFLLQDGLKTTSWGTVPSAFGFYLTIKRAANPQTTLQPPMVLIQAWGGNRACPDLVKKFFPNGNVPTERRKAW